MKLSLIFALVCMSLGVVATLTQTAGAQGEAFYKGKIIRLVVGSTTGNFYDSWPRLVGRHWGKYIPGNPEVMVQNMPGAGSVTAANYVYGVARPDGLTVVLPNNSIYIEQLVGRKEAQFDLRKFHWIGSASQDSILFYIRADTPFKSVGDIIKAKQPPSCGGSGTTSSDYLVAKILDLTLGANHRKVVQAMLSGGEFVIARKEIRTVPDLESKKDHYGIKTIKPRENHNAYSVHFYEPGGNYWEIESYEHAVEHGMGKTTNPHWTKPLALESFAGKGYVPQALTHGTLENDDLAASERFYREALGLDVVKLWPSSCYVKHPATPWYIVCIQAQHANRRMLSRYQRFTLALAAEEEVRAAHEIFAAHRDSWRLRALEDIVESAATVGFQCADLNGNWWEIRHGD